MSDRVGLIFTLPGEMLKRGLREGKDVFAKISNRSAEPGWTFYLYGSHDPRAVLAEATITKAHHMKARNVWEEYGERLFQERDEFNSYIRGRRHKDMLVLELENIKKYSEPVTPPGNITVAGLYVDEAMQKQIEKRKKC